MLLIDTAGIFSIIFIGSMSNKQNYVWLEEHEPLPKLLTTSAWQHI